MGPGRSSSLRIDGDSSAIDGSGQTGGVSDWLELDFKTLPRRLLFPWTREREK